MGLAAGFLVVTWVISTYFFSDISVVLQDQKAVITPEIVTKFKWAQLLSALLTFVVPALLFGYFSSPRPLSYVGLHNVFSPAVTIASVLLLVAVQPFVGWLGTVNSNLHFGPYHEVIKKAEATYTRAMEAFLQMRSAKDLVINLVIMAVLPAIGEELFFRGSLQKVLLRWNKIPWLSILISSFVFAFLHGTVFKVMPIFVLGIMLGTVYYVTRNLWYCILIHFMNNALAVLAVYYSDRNETIKKFANDNFSLPFMAAILSLLATIAIIYFMKKQSDKVLPAYTVDEDNDYIA
jgi:hypothetical protein